MVLKTKKATFNLHQEVLAALDEAVAKGLALSKNALVEQALLKETKALLRQERKVLWQQAKDDAMFVRDIEAVENDFRHADAETVGTTVI